MTKRDDIIRLARQIWGESAILPLDQLEAFFHAAQKLERDECAEICDALHYHWRWGTEPDSDSGPRQCRDAIRNRSNHETK